MPAKKDSSRRVVTSSDRELVANWAPTGVPAEQWNGVAGFVQQAVLDFLPFANEASIRGLIRTLAAYTSWAHHIAGIELSRPAILDHEQIAFFYATVAEGISFSSRTTMRARLMRMADYLVPEQRRTVRMPSYPKPPARAPYSADEVRQIRAWPMEQPTRYQQDAAGCIVNYGLGAGLRTGELVGLRREDVIDDHRGVLIAVSGEFPRLVPVLADYESACLKLAQRVPAGSLVFRPGRTAMDSAAVSAWGGRLVTETGFTINMSRLRATWLIGHLNRGVPTNAIATIGGYKTFTAFDRYLPWLESAPLESCRDFFRGPKPAHRGGRPSPDLASRDVERSPRDTSEVSE